jgi:hypothetical protein
MATPLYFIVKRRKKWKKAADHPFLQQIFISNRLMGKDEKKDKA